MAESHAAAIAVRRTEGGHEVLLVRPSSGAPEWVLPKGHIESGESAEQAALRELCEEAGVTGRIVASLGALALGRGPGAAYARIFLVEAHGLAEAQEDRECAWLPFDQAIQAASFPESRRALRMALRHVEAAR